MATFKLKIDGAKELQGALKELPKRLANKVVRQSMRAALKPLQAQVKSNAPRRTGALQKSVIVRATKYRRGVIAIDVRLGPGNFKGKTYYAAFQEFGTKRMEARHFMLKAYESQKESVAATTIQLIREGLDREVASLKR